MRLATEVQKLTVDVNVAPGASAAVAVRQEGVFHCFLASCGSRRWDGLEPIVGDEMYDLASVTKSIFATVLALQAQRGHFDLDATLDTYLRTARGTPAGQATVIELLSHRAGLRAHVEFFAPLRQGLPFNKTTALEQAMHATRESGSPPGPVYSDLGYLLLGEAVRQHLGQDFLGDIIASELRRLGLSGLRPLRLLTERQSAQLVPTETVGWRGGEVCGQIHDDNAFAFAGTDLCGHAGMFGTAPAVLEFACCLLDICAGRHPSVPSAALEPLLRARSGGTLRAGFDGQAAKNSSAGQHLSEETFGHLGFTGTSFWCDPVQEIAVVFLSNRVCPRRDNINIRTARPRVHDLLAEHALALRGTQDA